MEFTVLTIVEGKTQVEARFKNLESALDCMREEVKFLDPELVGKLDSLPFSWPHVIPVFEDAYVILAIRP